MGSRYRSPKQMEKKEDARRLIKSNPGLDNYELASKAGISRYQAEAIRREIRGTGLFKPRPKPEVRPLPRPQALPASRRPIWELLPRVSSPRVYSAPEERRTAPPKPK